MKTNIDKPNNTSQKTEDISLTNLVLAIILAPVSSFGIIIFFTSAIQFIAQEHWSQIPIIWPPALYLGGIIGGTIGGLIAYIEIRSFLKQNHSLSSVQLFSSDLFYVSLLILLTYILELLSESLLFQGLLFILEIAFFTVIGRNISRKSVEILTMTEEPEIQETDTESELEHN
ncbi:MAG: hypothetical protein ACFFAE_09725 [Candidatus Hodarchaeota archaeon]